MSRARSRVPNPAAALGAVTVTAAVGVAMLSASPAVGAAPRPFTAQDLVTMARISDHRVSPDGRLVAFTLRTTDLEADRGRNDVWLAAVDAGSPPRRLTTHEAGDSSARWAPDGDGLYFLSSRSGSSQVWYLPLAGGEAEPVTDLPLDVGTLAVSPDGTHLAVGLEVFPDCPDLACTTTRLAEGAASPRSGRVYDRLFVRHWDTWKDGRRAHLFVVPARGREGSPVDVTAGLDADVPSKPFGGDEEIAFTPDGKGLVFSARVAGAGEPWSTNFDLYYAPSDGSAPPRPLTDNPAWDTQPAFSPDGETLVYLAMDRAGFEADRFRIVARAWNGPDAVGPPRVLTEAWDRSPSGLVFAPDGRTIYTTAQDTGENPLFAVDVATGEARRLVAGGQVRSPQVAGRRLVFGRDDLDSPVDLYTSDLDGGDLARITAVNDEALAPLGFGAYEPFSFAGWNGETVHAWLVEPVGRVAGKRYPVAFIIHGGPQGSSDNDFHYRWNPQVYAGAGFGVVMVDFHGSTGYGQAFTDSIRGDWGGKPLEDLQKGLAAALERYDFLDGERVCALGASYGGYMINWIAGNWPDRFACLVNHDGLFDMRDMYYSTEELWFPEWEHGGPYHDSPGGHERHNPAAHVTQWRTPMLVVHGGLDYRVVETQGLATFTALQRRGIPSKMLYFPDENHWVLRPNNSLQWHEVVLGWLHQWVGGG